MKNLVRRLVRRRDDGATAVEYGLLVALIAVVLAAAAFALGGAVRDKLNDTADCVDSSTAANCPAPPAGP
jgi:pilus assembly protein Flp/PilA